MKPIEIIKAYRQAGLTYLDMGEDYFIEYAHNQYLLGHEETCGHITALPDKIMLAVLTDLALGEMEEEAYVCVERIYKGYRCQIELYDAHIPINESFTAPTRHEATLLAYQWFIEQKNK